MLPGDEFPLIDPQEIRDSLEHQVDLVIDGGFGGIDESTVIDLSGDVPELLRPGLGDFSDFIAN
jgi:tRNA A37 threonylcarbamoyladenosine synthetase subunit TsaC/SUA5/YrdC